MALDALDTDGSGGSVRIRGPLGLSRVARTRVLEAVPSSRLRAWLARVFGEALERLGEVA